MFPMVASPADIPPSETQRPHSFRADMQLWEEDASIIQVCLQPATAIDIQTTDPRSCPLDTPGIDQTYV